MKKSILALLVTALAFAAVVASGTSGASTKSQSSAATALVTCGKTRTLGFMAPVTGPAADIGLEQVAWAKFYVARYNRTHSKKFKLQTEDTMLGAPTGTAEALKGAQALAGNAKVLALAGPAGSNEIVGVTKTLKDAGLAWVSGSSTRTSLTTDGTRTGFMFRTVPPDAIQGTTAANFILKTLKYKRVYIIDDQETYSTGLADTVQSRLKAAGVSVTRDSVSQQQSDFTPLIAKIPRDTQIVYIPWQLAPKAQLFYTQLRAAGKSAIVFGSDGLFAPGTFTGNGSYVSAFPVDFNSGTLKAYARTHGGQDEAFGLPSYTAALVNATAINMACANGTASRAEVRKDLLKVNLGKAQSLLGFRVRFLKGNAGTSQGPGDMAAPANFAVFHIVNGQYVRVG
jgi:branched-chain amino acid transport system substrate-binding protein